LRQPSEFKKQAFSISIYHDGIKEVCWKQRPLPWIHGSWNRIWSKSIKKPL